MGKLIVAHLKSRFLEKFLNECTPKNEKSEWVLNQITNHECLETLKFVKDASVHDRGMIITVKGSEGLPFQFFLNGKVIESEEEYFFEVEEQEKEGICLQINFDNPDLYKDYEKLIEAESEESDDQKMYVDALLNVSRIEAELMHLKEKVNAAVKECKEAEFKKLSTEFKVKRSQLDEANKEIRVLLENAKTGNMEI